MTESLKFIPDETEPNAFSGYLQTSSEVYIPPTAADESNIVDAANGSSAGGADANGQGRGNGGEGFRPLTHE